jgi:hypothetical protein
MDTDHSHLALLTCHWQQPGHHIRVGSLESYNTNTSTLSSDIADAGSSVGGVCVGRLE